ncbi:hypothetical protein [Azospirillum soli]|uniref:hypothetical protein n=1 Tax=Azospirillum soli TaxID=1304799 RepID=UPI001AE31A3F|nr:hypothetical protein [Azospirillum soli]MBP2311879.1 hypothetical protein [Azospirillum soli]
MGGGEEQQTVQQQSVPAYIQNQHTANLNTANTVTDQAYQPYTGPRIADWTPDQVAARDMLRRQVTGPQLGMGHGAAENVAAYNPQQITAAQIGRGDIRDVTAGKFTDANLSAYMSPYTGAVIDTTNAELGRQNDILQNQTNARAAAAGAFGGSRQAILNAENNRNFMDTVARSTAQLNNQNFAQAQSAIGLDQNRALQAAGMNQQMDWNTASQNASLRQQADLANQSAGLQGMQLRLGASDRLRESAQAVNSRALTNAAALSGIGGQQQAMNQANLDLAYQDFQRQRDYALQQLQQRNAFLNPGMSMGGTSTTTAPGPGFLQTGLGTIAGIGGTYSMLTGRPLFGATGLLGSLGGGAGTVTAPIIDSTANIGTMIA